MVVLSAKEFDALMEELEDLEDIKLYDEAKKEDDGERIPFSEYLKKQKSKKWIIDIIALSHRKDIYE